MGQKSYAHLTCFKFTPWLKTGQNKLCAFDVLGFYFLIDENGLQTIIDFEILCNLYDFPNMLYEALDVSFVETGCGYRVLVRVL